MFSSHAERRDCRNSNETRRERESQREFHSTCAGAFPHDSVERLHRMPQFPYFVSTNQEVQTHRGAPHQPPVLQINPSTCHWNVTAGEEEWKQRQTSIELHNFLTGDGGSDSCSTMDGKITSFTSLLVHQGCYMPVLFSNTKGFGDSQQCDKVVPLKPNLWQITFFTITRLS